MKIALYFIFLIIGISFAVTAGDFPCISKIDNSETCWVMVRDPRDGQEYLAEKNCFSSQDSCSISYVENSRYKSKNAKCGNGDDFYYGCLYPNEKEASKYACPGFTEKMECNFINDISPTYFLTSVEYANLKNKILNKEDIEIKQMFLYKKESKGEKAAAPCGAFWIKYDGSWGEPTCFHHSEEVYWRCGFRVPAR